MRSSQSALDFFGGDFLSGHEDARPYVAFAGGADVGVVAVDTGDFRMVPTFGFAIIHQRNRLSAFGESATTSLECGQIHVGMGLVFDGSVSLVPGVAIPVNLDGASPSFVLGADFGF